MKNEGALTVAQIDTLVSALRGVSLRLDERSTQPHKPTDALTVGHAANVLDRMSMLYLLHDNARGTIDAAIATQRTQGGCND